MFKLWDIAMGRIDIGEVADPLVLVGVFAVIWTMESCLY